MSSTTFLSVNKTILKNFFILLLSSVMFICAGFGVILVKTKSASAQLGFDKVDFSSIYISEDKFNKLNSYSENNMIYEDIILGYALSEKSSDILYRPYKYVVDDSLVKSNFWDLGKRYYYGHNPENISYGFCFDGDYENGFISKNYQLPDVTNKKVVSIVICDYIDDHCEKDMNSLPRYNLNNAIRISNSEIIKIAVEQHLTGDGDFSWLSDSFDIDKQQFFSVLFEFENEVIYQCVGRIKVDINPSVEDTIVKSAWKEICQSGEAENYSYANYEITVSNANYLIKFFRNDSAYQQCFGLWYNKINMNLIDKFCICY